MRRRHMNSPRSPGRIRGWLTAAALIGAAAAAPFPAAPAPAAEVPPPRRIVSMNPCTDVLVWMLAERNRIVSLSHLAADPEVSPIAGEVHVANLNHGEAEEILPLSPDLVFNGPFSHRATTLLLRHLGLRVVEVDAANSLADIRRQVREVGRIIGAPARAEALIARMDARIAALAPAPGGRRPTAMNYEPNGFSAGAGTLIGDIIAHAGFTLPGGDAGYRAVSLEGLVADPPDVLILDASYTGAPTLATAILDNPVLKRLPSRRVSIPNRLWVCGTPAVTKAMVMLADVRRAWLARHGATP